MRHAPFIATRLVSFETSRQWLKQRTREPPKRRKSIFGTILEALYHSRRLQAERTLNQYRHLIYKADSNIVCESNKSCGTKDHGE